jgi:hypothetical protein
MKENKPTQNKLENTTNTNWLNVLAFGSEVIKPKAKNHLLQTHEPTFVVLP